MPSIRDSQRALGADRRGNVSIIFALCATVLIGLFGLGIDYWFAFQDKTRANAAADAAGLAAVNAAKAFYAANSGVSMPAETRSFLLKCWGSHPARRRCGLCLFRPYV